jgi:hypothetical protein
MRADLAETAALKKEVARLRVERDILKKKVRARPCSWWWVGADHPERSMRLPTRAQGEYLAARFPPERQTSCSALHRWWHRQGKFADVAIAES